MNLSGTDIKTERQKEDELAIGGMRQPRKAIGNPLVVVLLVSDSQRRWRPLFILSLT